MTLKELISKKIMGKDAEVDQSAEALNKQFTGKKPLGSLREALAAAPTVHEVLGNPRAYEWWYNGARKEALGEVPTNPDKPHKDWRP